MKTYHWVLIAVLIRLIASFTQLSTGHPDEWFQTVEFGNFIAFGFISQTQEFFLHMRNLTWPMLLAGALRAAHFIFPFSIAARMAAVKLTTAILDLSTLWAFSEILSQKRLSEGWKNFAWALFILPWFLVADTVRPSQEHLSIIAFWWALGLLSIPLPTRICSILAGVALVLTGAFRYPSGLFAVGALIAILGSTVTGKRKLTSLPWIFAGLILGLMLGGGGDWLYYGRPWESLWMYLQFNVLTGLSSSHFGSQSALEYLSYFRGTLGVWIIPVALLSCAGTITGLFQLEPWAFGLVTYLGGHLWVAHKEPRFMIPTLTLILWATVQGAWIFWRSALVRMPGRSSAKVWQSYAQPLRWLATLVLIANGTLLLRALWGETFRASFNYLELSELLQTHPACAVISIRRPVSTFLPWKDVKTVPEPAFAFFPAPVHNLSSLSLKEKPLIWIDHLPRCEATSTLLFQPQKAEEFWQKTVGCDLIRTGLGRLLPLKWITAPWYSCPASITSLFAKAEVRKIIAHEMPQIPELPPYGVSADEFLTKAWGAIPASSPRYADGTLGDW